MHYRKAILALLLLILGTAAITKFNLQTQVYNVLPAANGGTGNANGVAGILVFNTTTALACTSGGTTVFIGTGNAATNATETSVARFVVPVAMTLNDITAKIGGNVPSGETLVLAVSKNASTTGNPSMSIAAASSSQTTASTLALAAGDLVSISAKCSGGTTSLTAPTQISMMAN